jgi:hypothetical protein
MGVRHILAVFGVIGTLVAIAVFSYVVYVAKPDEGHSNPEALYTRMEAEIDFESVAGWAMECMGIESYENLPDQYQMLLSYYQPDINNVRMFPKDVKRLSPDQRAILALNRSISFEREKYRLRADGAESQLRWLTFIGIGMGMITTIVVSMSSTEFGRGAGRVQTLLRLLAISFPIIGTAVSGVIAFYSPQEKWNQARRTLASLTQLHAQMAVGVWNLKCDLDDGARKTVDGWSARYVDVQTAAAAGTSVPTTAMPVVSPPTAGSITGPAGRQKPP